MHGATALPPRDAGHQLAALSLEPEGSEVGRVERALCDRAGHLAPSVLQLAR